MLDAKQASSKMGSPLRQNIIFRFVRFKAASVPNKGKKSGFGGPEVVGGKRKGGKNAGERRWGGVSGAAIDGVLPDHREEECAEAAVEDEWYFGASSMRARPWMLVQHRG